MKLEEQLIQIAKANGLASLAINVHNVEGLEPFICVHTQIITDPGGLRQQGNGNVGEGHGIIPALHDALDDMHARAMASTGIKELAPLADSAGEVA